MPWVVGIDEAGYGPNLGPLVQTAVALKLPDHDEAGWETLRPHIRRASEKADGRVLVDDSKLVNQGKNGLAKLERGIAAMLGLPAETLAEWLRTVALPGVVDDLHAEPWFDGADGIPLHADPPECISATLAEVGVIAAVIGASAIPATLFNKVVAGSGTKATVLTAGVVGLAAAAHRTLPAGEPLSLHGDQLGGRRFYAPMLQAAFPDGWVVIERETADESCYRIENLNRVVRVNFCPRADAGCVSVALASMLAKYIREVCMRQFNRFWCGHVPGLKPTAGYPGDAKRYYEAIRPAMAKLGIADDAVWRVK